MLRFRMIGPPTLFLSDGAAAPRAPKQRQLLALLLLHPGQVVTIDECVDELWGERPPDSAQSTVRTYVMQVRKELQRGGLGTAPDGGPRLVTRDRGYSLAVAPGELDLDVFLGLVRQAGQAQAAGDDQQVGWLLHRALDLWSGPALGDITCGPILQMRLGGLEELRLGTLEDRIDADLRLGRHRGLISELKMLTQRYPLHENIHAQFMTALYRSGRRANALEVYARLRRAFSTELGLEPSLQLRRLQQAMLTADPALDPVLPQASAVG
ncbi:DNA-binding SARP family transcriptional activator [Kitasatospora sp. MAA4]|uniref:AfsR/SARP family transcriptional regulator n=1 Tax=Kitasatospora sp. MAA4 TaxID=3035093 RepID=UPI002473B1B6|nr:AfsR/SARP family transcriptional regulator [Kitasatospora sp. MAA4]MDH6132400.1 DNA-binding SARP family transcriptional activator [Kitasatospora sp. MAA4]